MPIEGRRTRTGIPVPLPDDICQHIGKIAGQSISKPNDISMYILHEYILTTLRERMTNLGCVYLAHTKPDSPYTNVIEYFRGANGDEFLKSLITDNDRFLLDNVLPWLGLTDWHGNSSWRAIQMTKFKSKLHQVLKLPPKEPAALPVSSAIKPNDYKRLHDELSGPASKKHNHEGGIGRKRLHTRKLRRKRKSKSKSKSSKRRR
jgi:hypothetical protein